MTERWIQHSQAELAASVLVASVDRAAVRRRLQRQGLELWPSAEPGAAHPLIVELWQVQRGQLALGGTPLEALGQACGSWVSAATRALVDAYGTYCEILFSLPDVRLPGFNEPCQLVLGMYTDSALSQRGAAWLRYGYGKQLATIERCDFATFTAHAPNAELRARFAPPRDDGKPGSREGEAEFAPPMSGGVEDTSAAQDIRGAQFLPLRDFATSTANAPNAELRARFAAAEREKLNMKARRREAGRRDAPPMSSAVEDTSAAQDIRGAQFLSPRDLATSTADAPNAVRRDYGKPGSREGEAEFAPPMLGGVEDTAAVQNIRGAKLPASRLPGFPASRNLSLPVYLQRWLTGSGEDPSAAQDIRGGQLLSLPAFPPSCSFSLPLYLRRWLTQPLLGLHDGVRSLSRLSRDFDGVQVFPAHGTFAIEDVRVAELLAGEYVVGGLDAGEVLFGFVAPRLPVQLSFPRSVARGA